VEGCRGNSLLFCQQVAQRKLNGPAKGTWMRDFNTDSCVLTSTEGRAIRAAAKVALEEKEASESTARTAKALAEAARLELCTSRAADETFIFRGALASKGKEDILDLIHISKRGSKLVKEKGKNSTKTHAVAQDAIEAELIKYIQDHLDAHLELKDNPRFAGLFRGSAHGQKRPAPDNGMPNPSQPPLQRHRLGTGNPAVSSSTPDLLHASPGPSRASAFPTAPALPPHAHPAPYSNTGVLVCLPFIYLSFSGHPTPICSFSFYLPIILPIDDTAGRRLFKAM
jgi:hypothetical protein